MRTIKRYSNRKLYDTEEKRYITLDQIAELVQDSVDIRVIDNQSGEDLTTVTMSQILVEQEKKSRGSIPKSFLTDLIQRSSSSLVDYLKRTVTHLNDGTGNILSDAAIDERVDSLVQNGEILADEGNKLRADLKGRAKDYKTRLDDFIEKRVHDVLSRLNIASKADIDALNERLGSLQTRLEVALEGDDTDVAAASSNAPDPSAPQTSDSASS